MREQDFYYSKDVLEMRVRCARREEIYEIAMHIIMNEELTNREIFDYLYNKFLSIE